MRLRRLLKFLETGGVLLSTIRISHNEKRLNTKRLQVKRDARLLVPKLPKVT